MGRGRLVDGGWPLRVWGRASALRLQEGSGYDSISGYIYGVVRVDVTFLDMVDDFALFEVCDKERGRYLSCL